MSLAEPTNFGRKIKELKRLNKKGYSDLSAGLKLSRERIIALEESEREPTDTERLRFARFYNLPPEEFGLTQEAITRLASGETGPVSSSPAPAAPTYRSEPSPAPSNYRNERPTYSENPNQGSYRNERPTYNENPNQGNFRNERPTYSENGGNQGNFRNERPNYNNYNNNAGSNNNYYQPNRPSSNQNSNYRPNTNQNSNYRPNPTRPVGNSGGGMGRTETPSRPAPARENRPSTPKAPSRPKEKSADNGEPKPVIKYTAEQLGDIESAYLRKQRDLRVPLRFTFINGKEYTGTVVDFTPFTIHIIEEESGEEIILRKLAVAYYRKADAIEEAREKASSSSSDSDEQQLLQSRAESE